MLSLLLRCCQYRPQLHSPDQPRYFVADHVYDMYYLPRCHTCYDSGSTYESLSIRRGIGQAIIISHSSLRGRPSAPREICMATPVSIFVNIHAICIDEFRYMLDSSICPNSLAKDHRSPSHRFPQALASRSFGAWTSR